MVGSVHQGTSTEESGKCVDIDNNSVDIDSQGGMRDSVPRDGAITSTESSRPGGTHIRTGTSPAWRCSGGCRRIERLLEVRRLDVLRPRRTDHGGRRRAGQPLAPSGRPATRDLRRTMMVGSGTLTPRLRPARGRRMAGAPARPRRPPRLRAGAHGRRAAAGSTARRAAARRREPGARRIARSRGRRDSSEISVGCSSSLDDW